MIVVLDRLSTIVVIGGENLLSLSLSLDDCPMIIIIDQVRKKEMEEKQKTKLIRVELIFVSRYARSLEDEFVFSRVRFFDHYDLSFFAYSLSLHRSYALHL